MNMYEEVRKAVTNKLKSVRPNETYHYEAKLVELTITQNALWTSADVVINYMYNDIELGYIIHNEEKLLLSHVSSRYSIEYDILEELSVINVKEI